MQYTNQDQQINKESKFIAEYNSEGIKTCLSYIEGDIKKSIYYHENGRSILINKINEEPHYIAEYSKEGICFYVSYIEGNIKKTIYKNEYGTLIKEIEEDKERGLKTTTNYDNAENNPPVNLKKVILSDKEGNIIEEKYSKTVNGIIEEYIDNKESNIISDENKYIILRKIENLENGAKKITEGNKIIHQYENEKITDTYRSIAEDNIDTISQKIIERNGERVVIQFNIQEYFTSALRTIQISNISIEESYKKDDFLPTFKVDGFEIPLDSVDKYKDICKKYDIESIFKVLGKNEPKATIQSKIKSFIDVFKR